MEWEEVYASEFDVLERMAVQDGWLYRNRVAVEQSVDAPGAQLYTWTVAITFVPDSGAPGDVLPANVA